ncbi:MAG TPA: hypothetical protein VFT42_04310 [Solirubrobacteraceae bacterium]|nr:hypothetical protein [Solirubrobacteraceae bacterium]
MAHTATQARPARARAFGPRWLFGPWTPWLRDVTDVLRLAFLIGVPVVLVAGPREEALRLALTFAVALLPRLLETPRPFDLAFNLAMSLQAWGNVGGAFDAWLPYHDIVHCLLTMAAAALFYLLLVRLRLVADIERERGIHEHLGMALIVFAIGSFVGAVYEEYEWFAINVMHAHLIENYQHDIDDLFFNAIGALAAGALLVLWARRGWTTRRADADDPLGGALRGFERKLRPDDDAPPAPVRERPAWMRAPADAIRLSFLAGIPAAALGGTWEDGARFAVTFLASLPGRVIGSHRFFDLLWVCALGFTAWGDFAGAFGHVPGYQDWTFFAVSLAAGPLLYLLLVDLRVLPAFERERRVHRNVAVFLAVMCLGYCVGIYYELYVWVANHAFGAHFPVSWDRLSRQLALDWAGAIAGAVTILGWERHRPIAAPQEEAAGRPSRIAPPPG